MRRGLLTTLLLAVGAVAPAGASAASIRVATSTELTAAIAQALPGDTITLASGSYGVPVLAGKGGPAADLTLRGEPGSTISGATITGSQRIVLDGLAVVPGAGEAQISVASSSVVWFKGMSFNGGLNGHGVSLEFAASATGVQVVNSSFQYCASPYCIKTSSPDVVIQGNTFDNLNDTDAVHGFGGGVIRGNHMDKALPHGNGNHNDFIQIGAGGPWVIDANWMGVRTNGAASIWLDPINGGLIHDAVISNNVVTGHQPGQYVGIFVGGDGTSAALLPRNVTVINNTVVAGISNSLRFGRAYATMPVDQRPLVVNNAGERLVDQCDRIRTSHNVFGFGQACSPTDVIGNPNVNKDTGAPSADSTLLINKGDPAGAPTTDFFGFTRNVGVIDIGAIELGASGSPPPPVKTHARAKLVSVKVQRGLHTALVRVRTGNSTRVTVTVLRNGRIVAKAAHAGSASKGIRLGLTTPRHGTLVFRVRAYGPGGGAERLVTVKARP